MAGDVDYMLRVAVADMTEYDAFYKRLIAIAPMKNVTSRFAMERMKHTTAYPLHPQRLPRPPGRRQRRAKNSFPRRRGPRSRFAPNPYKQSNNILFDNAVSSTQSLASPNQVRDG